MRGINIPARAIQRLTHPVVNARVAHYWPIDKRDQQSNVWRVIGDGKQSIASLDSGKVARIVYGSGSVPTAGFVSDGNPDYITELDPVWEDLGIAPGEFFFGDYAYDPSDPAVSRGMPFDPNNKSYLMFASWINEAGKTGGFLVDYFGAIPSQMWMYAPDASSIEFTYSSSTVGAADVITISHASTAGRVIRCAMLWDHVNKEHSAWLRDGNEAPDTPAAVSKAGQTTPQILPFIGFRYDDCQYYGGAVIELSAECTNAFAVADAVMADWEAGKKDLTGLAALEFA